MGFDRSLPYITKLMENVMADPVRLHFLKTSDVPEVPADVTVIDDYGVVMIHTEGEKFVSGMHIVVEGPEESIREWFRPLPGVWLGVGAPFMQQFEIHHVSEI
jgi:hypothetical protein